MQRVEDVGVVGVVLAAALAEPDEPGLVERRLRRRERGLVPARGRRRRACRSRCRRPRTTVNREARVDDLGAEPEGLEDLGGPVAVDGRDPHLREDLQHAVLERGLELGLRLGRMELAELVVVGHARHASRARAAGTRRRRRNPSRHATRVDVAGVADVDDERRLLTACAPRRAGGAPRPARGATGSARGRR